MIDRRCFICEKRPLLHFPNSSFPLSFKVYIIFKMLKSNCLIFWTDRLIKLNSRIAVICSSGTYIRQFSVFKFQTFKEKSLLINCNYISFLWEALLYVWHLNSADVCGDFYILKYLSKRAECNSFGIVVTHFLITP